MKVFLISILSCWLSACATTSPDIEIADVSKDTSRLNNVVFVDSVLQHTSITRFATIKLSSNRIYKVSVLEKGSRFGATGLLTVWANLENHTLSPLLLEARVSFYDGNSRAVESPTAWQHVSIHPKSVEGYQEFASSEKSVNYVIELREAK